MGGLRRCAAVGAVGAAFVLGTAVPAGADSSPRASCIGLIVSATASAGELDVDVFKAIGELTGARTFGQFVAPGARSHLGSIQACYEGIPSPG